MKPEEGIQVVRVDERAEYLLSWKGCVPHQVINDGEEKATVLTVSASAATAEDMEMGEP